MDIDYVIDYFNKHGGLNSNNKLGIVCETLEENIEFINLIRGKTYGYDFDDELLTTHVNNVAKVPTIFFGKGTVGPYDYGDRGCGWDAGKFVQVEYFKNIRRGYKVELL